MKGNKQESSSVMPTAFNLQHFLFVGPSVMQLNVTVKVSHEGKYTLDTA